MLALMSSHGLSPCEEAMRLWSEILQVEDTLFRRIFNHYRPELHYMRGPGPKWLEKHSALAECVMPQVYAPDFGRRTISIDNPPLATTSMMSEEQGEGGPS